MDMMTHKFGLLITLILISITSLSIAYEPTWLPDGEEVKAAVAARRGKTELSKLALSMKPGTWAELKTEKPPHLWSAPKPGKGLHIGTWSDDAHWDSRTGQFLFFGVRQTRKFVAYSEVENKWRVIDFVGKENAPGLKQKFGHQYSCNAFDPVNSIFFTLNSRYDVVKDQWAPLVKVGKPKRGPMTLAYSIDLKGLLAPTKSKKMRFFSEKENKWTTLGPAHAHGYHGIAQENPYRHEVLFMAGNNSQAVAIVDKDGNIHPMKDFPREGTSIRHHDATVDPQSGRYLILDPRYKEFYEFDADKNEYRLLDDSPPYGGGLVAHIPEYGVNMWAGGSKVLLYKHNPDGVTPSQKPQPRAKKLSWNSAVVGGEVTGGSPIPEAFLCINPGQDAGAESTNNWARVIPVGLKSGKFDRVIDKLKSGQKYFVRTFVANYVGGNWSKAGSFTTDSAPPEVAQLTIPGNQQIDGKAPSIAFVETPDHPLYAVGKSPNWLYKFSDYGPKPTPLHLGSHTLISDHARGRLTLNLNKGAISGNAETAIKTFRGNQISSSHIIIEDVGNIDIGGIDTHAEQTRASADYHAGIISIGNAESRAGEIRASYLRAYATGARAGPGSIRVYSAGNVAIGSSDKPGDIRTDSDAWNGGNITVDHFGSLVVGDIKTTTKGSRAGSPRAGMIALNGNDSSGDAAITSVEARNLKGNYGSDKGAKISISNYRNVTIGDIKGNAAVNHAASDLAINKGITGNISLTGKLDLSSKDKDNKRNVARYGSAKLACDKAILLAQLDLDLLKSITIDSGSENSGIKGEIANFDETEATGAGTENDPKVSGENRLRAPSGQKVHYIYKPGKLNDALGGHVWQLRNLENKGAGGLLVPHS